MSTITAVRNFENFGDCLKLSTPYSAALVDELKAVFPSSVRAWVPKHRVWVLSPTATNAEKAMKLLLKHIGVVYVDLSDENGHRAFILNGTNSLEGIPAAVQKLSGMVPWSGHKRVLSTVLSAEDVEAVRGTESPQQTDRTGSDPDSSLIDF